MKAKRILRSIDIDVFHSTLIELESSFENFRWLLLIAFFFFYSRHKNLHCINLSNDEFISRHQKGTCTVQRVQTKSPEANNDPFAWFHILCRRHVPRPLSSKHHRRGQSREVSPVLRHTLTKSSSRRIVRVSTKDFVDGSSRPTVNSSDHRWRSLSSRTKCLRMTSEPHRATATPRTSTGHRSKARGSEIVADDKQRREDKSTRAKERTNSRECRRRRVVWRRTSEWDVSDVDQTTSCRQSWMETDRTDRIVLRHTIDRCDRDVDDFSVSSNNRYSSIHRGNPSIARCRHNGISTGNLWQTRMSNCSNAYRTTYISSHRRRRWMFPDIVRNVLHQTDLHNQRCRRN